MVYEFLNQSYRKLLSTLWAFHALTKTQNQIIIDRSKNTVNILIKNMLDCLIGALTYWGIGWGLAYGPGGSGGFAGGSQFFAVRMKASDYPSWFFQAWFTKLQLGRRFYVQNFDPKEIFRNRK